MRKQRSSVSDVGVVPRTTSRPSTCPQVTKVCCARMDVHSVLDYRLRLRREISGSNTRPHRRCQSRRCPPTHGQQTPRCCSPSRPCCYCTGTSFKRREPVPTTSTWNNLASLFFGPRTAYCDASTGRTPVGSSSERSAQR